MGKVRVMPGNGQKAVSYDRAAPELHRAWQQLFSGRVSAEWRAPEGNGAGYRVRNRREGTGRGCLPDGETAAEPSVIALGLSTDPLPNKTQIKLQLQMPAKAYRCKQIRS